MQPSMTRTQFGQIQNLLESYTGIRLGEHKRIMVENRLSARLKAKKCPSYDDYLLLLSSGENSEEFGWFIDKLTTHETSFFREPHQFESLKQILRRRKSITPIRVWSAACATGEEAYSLAMLLTDELGTASWSLVGSDVSQASLNKARECRYQISLVERIPANYRKAYCLKGVGDYDGYFTVSHDVRRFCQFTQTNLLSASFEQEFEVIFLRNVLIYFDVAKQQQILTNVINQLVVGGYLFLGHSENVLKGHPQMEIIENCIYRRVA
ncbi:MCP methyltransferase, CheR-type [Vibrio sinaloensis DSM 21326]|uniref:Chemotaxis protein methyltransferase n=1 Tax=Vibrio sinaloensis DSM 21326 TaxID=945550 RepID=E8M6H2_PHOS4|nr:protein-glutamate O-methyltransferase CheR [Vibrio sinaloensis]EGA70290.1 MCP methyltransferase, CheR-type [Vibrio sinaloensis DSM 21326]